MILTYNVFRQKCPNRLLKEAARAKENVLELAENGIRMFPDELDVTQWIVELRGPVGSIYEGGLFYALFEATDDYP